MTFFKIINHWWIVRFIKCVSNWRICLFEDGWLIGGHNVKIKYCTLANVKKYVNDAKTLIFWIN